MGIGGRAMAELTMRQAIALALDEEMDRDERVVMFGEDVAAGEGVWKTSVGLHEKFGPLRVRDTPISEQAIVGAAIGSALRGLRPVAEIMFSDFLACAFDGIANELPKLRYMSGGQVTLPVVIRTANGGGVGFGAQHSQSTEAWTAQIPGLKTVSPSGPVEAYGLLKSSIRDDDPVIFFEHKALYSSKQDIEPGGMPIPLGRARVAREGTDVTAVAVAAMVSRTLEAAERLALAGISVEVIDLRSLVPLDAATVLASVAKTGRFLTVEESPRQFGWGGELASLVADEAFFELDAPVRRLAAPGVPLPAALTLEREVIPHADRIESTVRELVET